MTQVAILGTGLIGASIGLGLKAAESTGDIEITGFDISREREREAERRNAIDRRGSSLRQAVPGRLAGGDQHAGGSPRGK